MLAIKLCWLCSVYSCISVHKIDLSQHNLLYCCKSSNGQQNNMIKDIFKSNAKIEEYLCYPFLKQRNSFLNKMKKRGCGQRSLQMASEYLLFAIKTLNLSESDTSIVSLHRINASGAQRTDKNRFFYESTTINWLRDMGMIDPNFYDESIIFNKLSSRCHYRLRYHTYPLYHERISYLEYLSDSGAAFTTVRDHAIAQLYIIDLLNLKQGSIVRQIQIDDIVNRAKEGSLGVQFKVSRRWIKTFSGTANRWLRYSNILLEEKPYHIPGSDYVSQYLYWADNSKGLKRSTLDTRACELLRFTAYLNDKNQNIENIALTDIDGYICYRKSCGCARRTLATIITTLRDFLRYAYTQGWCSDLHIGLKTPKLFTMETLLMSPSWDDVKRLAGYYGTLDARGKRNSAIISMMAIYGMRSSEIAELHIVCLWKTCWL